MCRSKRMKGWQRVRREGIFIWRICQKPLELKCSAERPELETWVWEQLGHRRPGSLDEERGSREEWGTELGSERGADGVEEEKLRGEGIQVRRKPGCSGRKPKERGREGERKAGKRLSRDKLPIRKQPVTPVKTPLQQQCGRVDQPVVVAAKMYRPP